jgi:hypothetical protein
MPRQKLRNSIAMEAARLMLRGKETDYAAARKRAARWLSRRKVSATDMPSAAEIQLQLHALSGLFAAEHQTAFLAAMRAAALELMTVLEEYGPHLSGSAIDGSVISGVTLSLDVTAQSAADVAATLSDAGFRTRVTANAADGEPSREMISLNHGFPCEIVVHRVGLNGTELTPAQRQLDRYDLDDLRRMVEQTAGDLQSWDDVQQPADDAEYEYHPDAFASLEILLARLEQIQRDPEQHPEGDALYHSLQTFELGLEERPYDEEFLLACLLHDAGLAVDRRAPVPTLLRLLGNLVTERTRFLIEHLAAAAEYLKTGRMPRSLRRSDDFDDLVLLARCDRDGRERGAPVRELHEALRYVAGIDAAWDAPADAPDK